MYAEVFISFQLKFSGFNTAYKCVPSNGKSSRMALYLHTYERVSGIWSRKFSREQRHLPVTTQTITHFVYFTSGARYE